MTDNGLAALAAEPCSICGEDTVIRLPDDWQEQVEAGAAIPIIGCGNPWHYANLDGPEQAATLRAALDEAVPVAFGVPDDGKWYEVRALIRRSPYGIAEAAVFALAAAKEVEDGA
jgi:hypothetical protein